jgi:NAD(P)-dependent dehydrogenase (short-subunit alcohol dehydrogenase family)
LTVTYLPEEVKDAKELEALLREKTSNSCEFQFLAADLTKEQACQGVIQRHPDFLSGQLDTFIRNHGNQNAVPDIHPFFYFAKTAIPHLATSSAKQPTIVFNDSISAFKGNPSLVDCTTTSKGATLGFARLFNPRITGSHYGLSWLAL